MVLPAPGQERQWAGKCIRRGKSREGSLGQSKSTLNSSAVVLLFLLPDSVGSVGMSSRGQKTSGDVPKNTHWGGEVLDLVVLTACSDDSIPAGVILRRELRVSVFLVHGPEKGKWPLGVAPVGMTISVLD